MRISELYQSEYLKGADIPRPVRVVIAGVEAATFKDQQTQAENTRAVLAFENKRKKLVCNPTNARTLARALGDDTAGWIGRAVILAQGTAPNGAVTVVVSALPEETGAEGNGDNPF